MPPHLLGQEPNDQYAHVIHRETRKGMIEQRLGCVLGRIWRRFPNDVDCRLVICDIPELYQRMSESILVMAGKAYPVARENDKLVFFRELCLGCVWAPNHKFFHGRVPQRTSHCQDT